MLLEGRFNFSQFDAEAADLDLVIDSPEKVEVAVAASGAPDLRFCRGVPRDDR